MGGAGVGEQAEQGVWQRPARGAASQRALELVALRGQDVIGVRHVLDGRAHVGSDPSAIARVPKGEAIAEVEGDRFALLVPAGARGRLHQADGLARLLTGPTQVLLHEGDRAVLVLGSIQIRAQIVSVELMARSGTFGQRWSSRPSTDGPGLLRWVGLVGALYATALAICVVFAPRDRERLETGIARAMAAHASALVSAYQPVVEDVELRAAPQIDRDGDQPASP